MPESAEFAKLIAQEFAPLLRTTTWEILVAAGALGAALFAAVSAHLSRKGINVQNDTQRSQLLSTIHNRFFEITAHFPLGTTGQPVTRHHNQLLGNYFEYVSWLILKGKIKLEDVELLHTEMKTCWDNFAKGYRERNGDQYFNYWKKVVKLL